MNARSGKTFAAVMSSPAAGTRTAYVVVVPIARMVLALAGLAVVGAAGVAGYWTSAGPQAVDRLFSPPPPPAPAAAFIELPEVIVNLHPEMPSRFMKIGITLAVPGTERMRVDAMQPELMNALQEFLRNLDQRDLDGSAGIHRLRSELKRRLALIAGDGAIDSVLLRSLLTQ